MKKLLFLFTVSLTLIPFLACTKRSATLKTDVQKASYAIGQQIGREMKAQGVEIDADALAVSVQDVLGDKQSQLSVPEMQQAMMAMREKMMAKQQKMMEERMASGKENKEKGDKYLEENKKKPGVKVAEGGLQYEVLTAGKGKKPKDGELVSVNYRGTFIDGSEFDSSAKHGGPAKFRLGEVIKGWTQALKMMPVGSKWKLTIPSDLAYGPMGNPAIPPNSVLVFDVELLDIVKDEAKK